MSIAKPLTVVSAKLRKVIVPATCLRMVTGSFTCKSNFVQHGAQVLLVCYRKGNGVPYLQSYFFKTIMLSTVTGNHLKGRTL